MTDQAVKTMDEEKDVNELKDDVQELKETPNIEIQRTKHQPESINIGLWLTLALLAGTIILIFMFRRVPSPCPPPPPPPPPPPLPFYAKLWKHIANNLSDNPLCTIPCLIAIAAIVAIWICETIHWYFIASDKFKFQYAKEKFIAAHGIENFPRLLLRDQTAATNLLLALADHDWLFMGDHIQVIIEEHRQTAVTIHTSKKTICALELTSNIQQMIAAIKLARAVHHFASANKIHSILVNLNSGDLESSINKMHRATNVTLNQSAEFQLFEPFKQANITFIDDVRSHGSMEKDNMVVLLQDEQNADYWLKSALQVQRKSNFWSSLW